MKRRSLKRRTKLPPLARADEDLQATSRAIYELEDRRRPDTQRSNESIEDPLQDWPESSGEPDRWLDERHTPSIERER